MYSLTALYFISSYFLVPKSDGSMRFVLNLKKLNSFMSTKPFKLEDIRTAAKLISRHDFMCCIDLQDAYFLVAMHSDSRKFSKFKFEDRLIASGVETLTRSQSMRFRGVGLGVYFTRFHRLLSC